MTTPRIRPATLEDAPGIAAMHVQSWQETYAGLLPPHVIAALSVEERQDAWRRILGSDPHQVCLVVEAAAEAGAAGGQIVGFVEGGTPHMPVDSCAGELRALYLLRAHQRQGLGRALFTGCLRGLAARGLRGLYLWVLAGNPSERFYRRLGGRLDRIAPTEIRGLTVKSAMYTWKARPD